MPRTKKDSPPRISIGIPKRMIDEVDRIVENHKEFNYNRQQFIESAIREKIMRLKLLEAGLRGVTE